MNQSRTFYLEKAILFIVVVVPLALAEGVWWYLGASLLAIGLGWWTLVGRRKPFMSAVTSRAFVLAAFGLLLVEYVWLIVIPVVALSHFMTLVCASKFLQERTLRDDAQLAVLCMLLLVVAAIVSGNVIFLGVVLVYLTIGLDVLIRFNLALERVRVERANAIIQPAVAVPGGGNAPAPSGGVLLLMAPFALLVGAAVFTFFPRVGAGMFGRGDARGGGIGVTGFSGTIDFDTIGPITESDRQVMRVHLSVAGGAAPAPESGLYLRGRVYEVYARSPSGRGWDWQRVDRPPLRTFDRGEVEEDEYNLLPDYDPPTFEPIITQRFTIEPGTVNDSVLFALYPPLTLGAINSDEVETVGKALGDGSLRTGRPVRKMLRYTVKSAAEVTPAVVKALDAERDRQRPGPPRVHQPDPPLPREDEIRQRIAPLAESSGPLDVPENRAKFAESVSEWLRSSRFVYTLSPLPLRPGAEPISDFLLRHRSGYCQHFASAMVVMCQLAGVPARLVSGFRCDDYNSMGKFWSVRGRHAHAWVEVYIPGRDWVRYDPTPAASGAHAVGRQWLRKLRNYGDYIQWQWANLVLAYDAQARRDLLFRFSEWLRRPAQTESTIVGKVAGFVYELFAWRVQMTWQDRLLYWVFALLIVAMVLLIGYVVVVLSWRGISRLWQFALSRRAGAHKMGDAVFYYRLCRRLSSLGFRRRPEQTPAEFAADLASRYPALAPASGLVNAYYEVVYGGRGLTPDRREEFEGFLDRLNQVDKTALSGS